MRKDCADLIAGISRLTGMALSAYCRSGLGERIEQRLAACGCASLAEYEQLVERRPEEVSALSDTLIPTVSGFFREPSSFEYLEAVLLPELLTIGRPRGRRSIRVWSAGCAAGEEPYSFAILFLEATSGRQSAPPLELFATDINRRALAAAVQAVYPAESLQDIRYGLLGRYFRQHGDLFQLRNEVRSLVHFSCHDLLASGCYAPVDSVFGSFDVVLCRNVLIYLKARYRSAVLRRLHKALAPEGRLVLGNRERLSDTLGQGFRSENHIFPIYCKRPYFGRQG